MIFKTGYWYKLCLGHFVENYQHGRDMCSEGAEGKCDEKKCESKALIEFYPGLSKEIKKRIRGKRVAYRPIS